MIFEFDSFSAHLLNYHINEGLFYYTIGFFFIADYRIFYLAPILF